MHAHTTAALRFTKLPLQKDTTTTTTTTTTAAAAFTIFIGASVSVRFCPRYNLDPSHTRLPDFARFSRPRCV